MTFKNEYNAYISEQSLTKCNKSKYKPFYLISLALHQHNSFLHNFFYTQLFFRADTHISEQIYMALTLHLT